MLGLRRLELLIYSSVATFRKSLDMCNQLVKKPFLDRLVDANSTANFGVGAFLLAASEMIRLTDKQ